LISINYKPVGMVVVQINQFIMLYHTNLVAGRRMDLFKCALKNAEREQPQISAASEPFIPATMSQTDAPVHSPPDGPAK
jgi:hypothetical protein